MINSDNKRLAYEMRERGYTWDGIGSNLGISRKTAKRWAEEYEPRVRGPEAQIERFKPLHVQGDAAITCDWHVPLHSPRMVNSLLENIHKMDIHQLVIAGDLFNMDSFSHFEPTQTEAKFELEREEATNLINAALDVVDEVIIIWGNHDFRIVKFLGFKFSFEYCMRWVLAELGEDKLKRVVISDLDHMIYHPGYYDIYVCHPQNFSSRPLTVARDLVPKFGKSVLTAHSHHFAQGVAYDGSNLIFDGGGLFSPDKTEYIRRTNRHHRWAQGYHIWKSGICYPFSPIYYNM